MLAGAGVKWSPRQLSQTAVQGSGQLRQVVPGPLPPPAPGWPQPCQSVQVVGERQAESGEPLGQSHSFGTCTQELCSPGYSMLTEFLPELPAFPCAGMRSCVVPFMLSFLLCLVSISYLVWGLLTFPWLPKDLKLPLCLEEV